jgi:hypothetical protein
MFAIKIKFDHMKTINFLFILCLPIALFSQWTFKTVNNGFDKPYKIAYTAIANDARLKLEPVEVEVPLPKKYVIESSMHVIESSSDQYLSAGISIDFNSGYIRSQKMFYSKELIVIAGQATLDTNGYSKAYLLIYDGEQKLFCDQNDVKFSLPATIPKIDIRRESQVDSLISIAKILYAKNQDLPQLYERKIEVSFYLSGGYHCDDEIPVDISFLVGGKFKQYNLTGSTSSDNTTVFFSDDLNSSEMKADFLNATSVKLRFNESHCQTDYYEFKMSGSTAALNFVSKP